MPKEAVFNHTGICIDFAILNIHGNKIMHKVVLFLIVLNILFEKRETKMYNRRRSRRNHGFSGRRRAKPNFTPVILILCLSVACGYATAKYVVEPVVNYVPQFVAENSQNDEVTEDEPEMESKEKSPENDSKVVEDDVNVKSTEDVSGYALQFGCYSSKAAAQNAESSLDINGLRILEQDGMYKIIGKVYESKEQAKEALEGSDYKEKAFVTTIYE